VGQHGCRLQGAAFPTDFDLVLRDARQAHAKRDQPTTDIGVKDGRIAVIAPRGEDQIS
jgi:N-acyl-D-aspartate/D-glutamate deacylase